VTVSLELRGEAPGLKEGGMVEQLMHELELECEATDVPEKIEVNVNTLGLNESITAGELELPSTAKIGCTADTVVVQCVVPTVAPEEEEALAGEAGEGEPEVIGRKPGEEEAESE
jgi:large subunit ribosomal protein L25